MKYYKITLHKSPGGLKYPSGIKTYQSEIGDHALDHIYYDGDSDPKTTHLLLVLPDNITGVVREDVEELTELAAKALSEKHEAREETVTDDAKIKRLTIKASAGMELTSDELKAIDPDDPTPGIGKKEILSDRIDKLKNI